MEKFTFNGDWKFDLNLSELAKLNSDRFYKYEIRQPHKLKLLSGRVPVTIYDENTDDPDPIIEQILCVNWIIENQKEIIESVYNDLTTIIWPYYKKMWENDYDNEYSYPKISHYSELDKAVGMDSIGIHFDKKDGIAYFNLYFSFCTDEEHGLAIIYHKSRMIDYGGIGDVDNKKILEDQGINYEDWFENRIKEKEKKELKLHYPHPKYGKLKPWQSSDNNYYPFGLLHADRDSDIMQYLISNKDLTKKIIDDLIKIAEYKNKEGLLKELKKLWLTKNI